MTVALDQRRYWLPIGIGLFGVSTLNATIFALGLSGGMGGRTLSDPPGWIIAGVWTLLFALMGVAFASLPAEARGSRWGVIGLALLCLAYPLYTFGLSRPMVGIAGNFVTALAATLLIGRLWLYSRRAALVLVPIVVWLAFASWTILV
jgi:tryptophan-rich sensory protein